MSGTLQHVTKQACFSVTESAYNFFFNGEREFFITGEKVPGVSTQ